MQIQEGSTLRVNIYKINECFVLENCVVFGYNKSMSSQPHNEFKFEPRPDEGVKNIKGFTTR